MSIKTLSSGSPGEWGINANQVDPSRILRMEGRYRVTVVSGCRNKNNNKNLQEWIAYTDGSVKQNLAGSGFVVYLSNRFSHEFSISLGNDTTIFEAELLAILHLCLYISSQPPSTAVARSY